MTFEITQRVGWNAIERKGVEEKVSFATTSQPVGLLLVNNWVTHSSLRVRQIPRKAPDHSISRARGRPRSPSEEIVIAFTCSALAPFGKCPWRAEATIDRSTVASRAVGHALKDHLMSREYKFTVRELVVHPQVHGESGASYSCRGHCHSTEFHLNKSLERNVRITVESMLDSVKITSFISKRRLPEEGNPGTANLAIVDSILESLLAAHPGWSAKEDAIRFFLHDSLALEMVRSAASDNASSIPDRLASGYQGFPSSAWKQTSSKGVILLSTDLLVSAGASAVMIELDCDPERSMFSPSIVCLYWSSWNNVSFPFAIGIIPPNQTREDGALQVFELFWATADSILGKRPVAVAFHSSSLWLGDRLPAGCMQVLSYQFVAEACKQRLALLKSPVDFVDTFLKCILVKLASCHSEDEIFAVWNRCLKTHLPVRGCPQATLFLQDFRDLFILQANSWTYFRLKDLFRTRGLHLKPLGLFPENLVAHLKIKFGIGPFTMDNCELLPLRALMRYFNEQLTCLGDSTAKAGCREEVGAIPSAVWLNEKLQVLDMQSRQCNPNPAGYYIVSPSAFLAHEMTRSTFSELSRGDFSRCYPSQVLSSDNAALENDWLVESFAAINDIHLVNLIEAVDLDIFQNFTNGTKLHRPHQAFTCSCAAFAQGGLCPFAVALHLRSNLSYDAKGLRRYVRNFCDDLIQFESHGIPTASQQARLINSVDADEYLELIDTNKSKRQTLCDLLQSKRTCCRRVWGSMYREGVGQLRRFNAFFNDDSDSDSCIARSRYRRRASDSLASFTLEDLQQFQMLDSAFSQKLPIFTRLTEDFLRNLGLMWRSTKGAARVVDVLSYERIIAKLAINKKV